MSVNGSSRWRLVNVRTTEHQRNLRLERASHSATVVGSSIYIVGGRRGSNQFFSDLLKFDTASYTWTVVCPVIPNGFRGRANHTATLVGGRQLWVVSGSDKENVLDDVHVLDVVTMAWSKPQIRGDATLLKRTAHSADLHPTDSSSILLFGGYGPTSGATEPTFLNDLVLLRTGSRTVERLVTIVGPLPGVVGAAGAGAGLVGVAPPLPRAYHSCTSLGGRLYVYGGRTDAAVLEDRQQLAVFDPAVGAWLDPGRVGGAMPLGRSSHRAVALGNRLLIHGGAAAGDQADRLGDVLTLLVDPKTGALTWSRMDEPPPPATGSAAAAKPHGRSAHTISLVGSHHLFVIAGYVGSGTGQSRYTSDVYLLQLGTPAAEPMPALTLPRAQAAQAVQGSTAPQQAAARKRTPSPPGRQTAPAAQPPFQQAQAQAQAQVHAQPAAKPQPQPSVAHQDVTAPMRRAPPSPPRAASAMGDTGQSAGSRRTPPPPSPDGGRSASPHAPSAVSRLGTSAGPAAKALPAAQLPAAGRGGRNAAGGATAAAAGGSGGTGAYGVAQDLIDLTAEQAPVPAAAKSPARTPVRRGSGAKADAAAGPTMEGQWLGGGRRGRSALSDAAAAQGQEKDAEAAAGARPAKRQATEEAVAAAGTAQAAAATRAQQQQQQQQQQQPGAPLQRASSASGAAMAALQQPEQSLPHPLQQGQPHQHLHPLGHGPRHGSAPPMVRGGVGAAVGAATHVTAAASARVPQQQPGSLTAGAPAVGLTWQTQTELRGLPPGSGPDTATIAAAATAAATAAVAATTAAAAAGGQQPQGPAGGSAPAAYLHRPPSPPHPHQHQPQVQVQAYPPPQTAVQLGSNSQNDLLNGLLQQLQRAQDENAELRRQVQDSAALAADLALARRNADAATAERRAKEQELAHAQANLDAERTQAAAMRQQLAAAQQAAAAATAQLADRERTLRDAEAARQSEDRARQEERRIQEDRCRGLEAQHQRAAAEVASLRSAVREEQLRRGEELKERDRELAELRTQLRTAASRNQDQEGALRRVQDERQRSERELAEARDANQQLQRQLNDTSTEFTRFREKAQAELAQASARLANVEAELRRARDDLAHKEAQYAAVGKAHAEAAEEAKGLREQLRLMTARLDAARQQAALLTTHQATIVSALQAAQGASGALDKALSGAPPPLG